MAMRAPEDAEDFEHPLPVLGGMLADFMARGN